MTSTNERSVENSPHTLSGQFLNRVVEEPGERGQGARSVAVLRSEIKLAAKTAGAGQGKTFFALP